MTAGIAPERIAEKRVRRSKQERRRIVEATIGTGVSIARVARAHGVNANQVYAWRRLYEKGLLGPSPGNQAALVPVRITESSVADTPAGSSNQTLRHTPSGAIQIEFARARVHIEGTPEPATLRTVLECLLG
jgi:transposase